MNGHRTYNLKDASAQLGVTEAELLDMAECLEIQLFFNWVALEQGASVRFFFEEPTIGRMFKAQSEWDRAFMFATVPIPVISKIIRNGKGYIDCPGKTMTGCVVANYELIAEPINGNFASFGIERSDLFFLERPTNFEKLFLTKRWSDNEAEKSKELRVLAALAEHHLEILKELIKLKEPNISDFEIRTRTSKNTLGLDLEEKYKDLYTGLSSSLIKKVFADATKAITKSKK